MKKENVPENVTFRCSLKIEAAAEGKTVPSFSMVAYTGGKMVVAGFEHPVVVDLKGLSIDRQNIPVRLDHNPKQGVGHTERVIIADGQVVAEGLISRDTSWARDVAKSGSKGFPWQASIGADVIHAEFIPNGSSVKVNGRQFTGPVYVIRQAVLKEISFVDTGADSNTSAKVAAKSNERSLDMEKGEEKDNKKETQDKQVKSAEEKPAAETEKEVKIETPEPAKKQDETKKIQASAVKDDPVPDMRERIAAEKRRISAIEQICKGEFPDIEAKAIEEGWETSRCELEVLRASRPNAPAVHTPKLITGPAIFEATAMMASGMTTSDLEARYDVKTLEAAEKMRGVGFQEFCEIVCGGISLPRFRRDASGWLEAAFSTTSLPGILSNIANKMLLEGYNYIEDAWRKICKIASVNDFKEHTRYRMTGTFQFEKVGADGELKHGKLSEMQFGQRADTHGIMFGLTRQMIINDDMGAFTDIPRQIGMGAAEAIADAVWTLLLSNPNNFFHTSHKNYKAGAETALGINSLTDARVMFSQQTKPNGKPLGIAAALLLVPTALEVIAELLMTSKNVNELTPENTPKPNTNPHTSKYEVVSSAYLSNAAFTGSSELAWYLFADPKRLPALEVAFLNGVDRPTVERTDADFNTLGILFRGFIDFGVREQDWRGALKFKGEA